MADCGFAGAVRFFVLFHAPFLRPRFERRALSDLESKNHSYDFFSAISSLKVRSGAAVLWHGIKRKTNGVRTAAPLSCALLLRSWCSAERVFAREPVGALRGLQAPAILAAFWWRFECKHRPL